MAAAADLDEIEEVNTNCILMANMQQASSSGTQSDKAPVYDSDGSAEVQLHDNCYNDEILNMFTQKEQYNELLDPIHEPHEVLQNDINVIYEVSNVEQGGGTVEQHPANVEETHELRAERLAKAHDPLALMANSNNPFNYPVFHPYPPSSSTFIQQPLPNNNYISQPSLNQNYMQQPMPNLEDITDPTAAINTNVKNQVVQYAMQNPGVQNGVIVVSGIAHQNRNGSVVAAWAEGNTYRNNGN
nr:hypothetical protein [Tanacetum cinerariifolium]